MVHDIYNLKHKSSSNMKRSTHSNPSKSSNNTSHNAGLGLSISYMIAACLGNNRKLSVESEVGKGSTFSFYIHNQSTSKKQCTLYP